MTKYKCPKCNEYYMGEIGGSFSCVGRACGLTFSRKEYLPIAAVICKKPLDLKVSQLMSEYKLPDEVVNKILEVLYEIRKVKEQKLEELTRKNINLEELKKLNEDGGLNLLLDF